MTKCKACQIIWVYDETQIHASKCYNTERKTEMKKGIKFLNYSHLMCMIFTNILTKAT